MTPPRRVWGSAANHSKTKSPSVTSNRGEEAEWDEGDWKDWKGGWSWYGGWQENAWENPVKPDKVRDKTEELAALLAEVELALELTSQQQVAKDLINIIASRWRESAIPD